ncbi:MAG: DUF2809 domain-containing protein [Prochloraceae cyanobacterium]|nr:DUF2809 domain-containing protein [Prochloraceae cyanobacterium]
MLSLIVIIPVGLWSKVYTGPGAWWVNDYAGDICYEIFWCLFIFFFIPKKKAISSIPLWVFGFTCLVEILQLSQGTILQEIRSFTIGRLILGTTFSWWDFPHYAIGSLIGWLWLGKIWQFQHQQR